MPINDSGRRLTNSSVKKIEEYLSKGRCLELIATRIVVKSVSNGPNVLSLKSERSPGIIILQITRTDIEQEDYPEVEIQKPYSRKLSADEKRAIERILSKRDRVQLIPSADGVKIMRVRMDNIRFSPRISDRTCVSAHAQQST